MSEGQSEFDVAAVVDALDVGVIVLDERQAVVGWNDWMARVTGRSRSAVLGSNLIELYPNLGGTRLPSVITDCLQTGSSSILTHSLNKLLPLLGDGGEELLHNIVVRPVWANGAPRCMLQVNDVSVAVARERVLRERQNARYHAIVDSAPDAIITIGLDRTIQWANGAAEQVFGYELSELLDQKLDVLLQHDDGLTQAFVELQNANSCTLQVNGRRKPGDVCQFEVSLGRWKADERVFITTIWRDVTERTNAEAALRASEGRHRALLEALPQLVWTCDQNGECDYFNPQWQAYTGAPFSEHLGSGWLKAIHKEDTPAFTASWKSALAEGGVFDADVRLCRSDGSHRWFKMRSIPVWAPDGSISRWFGTATDITDHVEAREALRRSNEELEALVQERTRERELALNQLHEAQKMETIGQLTGGVAHDFNNLLAVILGSLSLLKKWLPDDPRTSRLLDGALQGAERGATLTKRLLAFARRQELKLEAIEIQKLIPDMMDFLRQSLGPNINISIDIPPDVEPVKIDANQLELALMNLAVNARDAMPAGGALVITCRNAAAAASQRPPALPPGDYVCISVADTGEGMDQATLAKAMEPFFTTKGLGKGTGLGLSMVQGLTVQSGGALTMTSDVGKGTVVNLWLPRARREDMVAPAAGPPPVGGAAGKQLRVLLVDDDPLVRMNTAYLLMDLGHSVMEAQSGAQALQLLDSDARFDVLLTDYAMPGMTGLDLATRVKVSKPKLPIVLATGYAELPPDALLGFPRLGKPYTQEQLAESLEAAIRERVN
ncbi:MAG TPA: PAS domain S-box protein [Rhodopseudomonas sp.]|uniref:PAS domain S-box protein n=1 Tax=Rhodopseudomonas sp. TaxID=1078 RepID=UPI002ED7A29F